MHTTEAVLENEIYKILLILVIKAKSYLLENKKKLLSSRFYCAYRPQSENKRRRKPGKIHGPNQRIKKKLWGMKVTVISIVVGALGIFPKKELGKES